VESIRRLSKILKRPWLAIPVTPKYTVFEATLTSG